MQPCKIVFCAHSLAKGMLKQEVLFGMLWALKALPRQKYPGWGDLFLSIVKGYRKEYHSLFGGCGDCVLCWSLAKLHTSLMWGCMWLSVGGVWEFFLEVHV